MVAVARGAVLSASNPQISEFVVLDGKLLAPVSLSWSIYDISTGAKEDEPSLVAGPTSVNLVDDKVSKGRYAVAWTVPVDEPIGKHQIVWTAQLIAGGPTLRWRRELDVVQHEGLALGGYAHVSDLRAEGVTVEKASGARLARLIRDASDYIERATGTWFEPRPSTHTLDGNGRDTLFLQVPAIGLDSVTLTSFGVTQEVDSTAYRLYGWWTSPKDRWTPRIVRVSALQGSPLVPAYAWTGAGYAIAPVWPPLRQNVLVKGVFGYLEQDGSPAGGAPSLIRKACMMLVVRNLAPLGDQDATFERKNKHRIVSERTREQSYELAKGGGATGDGREAPFTGDPEIDQLLDAYSRPPYVGFAAA